MKNRTTRTFYLSFLALTNAFTPSCRNQIPFLTSQTCKNSLSHNKNAHQTENMQQHHKRTNYNSRFFFVTSSSTKTTTILRMSSVGDGNNDGNNFGGGNDGGGGGNDSGNNNLDEWLDPRKASSESDNLKRARAQISEESLPINFDLAEEFEKNDVGQEIKDSVEVDDDDDDDGGEEKNDDGEEEDDIDAMHDMDEIMSSSFDEVNDENEGDIESAMQDLIEEKEELTGKIDLLRGAGKNGTTTAELMSSNPYLQVVSKLSPSDLISKFTSTAHPRVQDAVRSTILGLIGTLPKMAFETTTITTGERLASLMFQLQLTGYMLKNADYRLSLSQSLGVTSLSKNGQNQYLLEGDLEYDEEDEDGSLSEGKVRGKIKITYGKNDKKQSSDGIEETEDDSEEQSESEDNQDDDSVSSSMEVEVDAAAYMAELRNEVAKLREDLVTTRKEKEDEIRKDLLLYIRTLPQKELKSLTGTLSDDVLNAMKGLVNVVMAGIGEGQIGPETVTEQSGEAMAQLCMWQLVVGYNLRELEVREEMKNALRSGSLDSSSENSSVDSDDSGGADFDQGGFE